VLGWEPKGMYYNGKMLPRHSQMTTLGGQEGPEDISFTLISTPKFHSAFDNFWALIIWVPQLCQSVTRRGVHC